MIDPEIASRDEPAGGRPALPSLAGKPWAAGTRMRGAAAAIHASLRADLVSLRRLPGEPLVEARLALAHGVSRTPVREAVLKLADEGLVEIFPQSGTFAARIPLDALPESIVIRRSLEETSAQLAARRATRSRIIALHAILERQHEAHGIGDHDAFLEADDAFHAAVADMAGHPGIWTLVQQVKVHVDRYRRLIPPQAGRMVRAIAEHTAVAAAIEAGKPRRAAEAVSVHLDGLLTDVPDIYQANREYFAGDIAAWAGAPPPGEEQPGGKPWKKGHILSSKRR